MSEIASRRIRGLDRLSILIEEASVGGIDAYGHRDQSRLNLCDLRVDGSRACGVLTAGGGTGQVLQEAGFHRISRPFGSFHRPVPARSRVCLIDQLDVTHIGRDRSLGSVSYTH